MSKSNRTADLTLEVRFPLTEGGAAPWKPSEATEPLKGTLKGLLGQITKDGEPGEIVMSFRRADDSRIEREYHLVAKPIPEPTPTPQYTPVTIHHGRHAIWDHNTNLYVRMGGSGSMITIFTTERAARDFAQLLNTETTPF